MAYHRMKPSFENETIDHFFLKADQHSADYGKASNLLFIGTILERKPVPTDISRHYNDESYFLEGLLWAYGLAIDFYYFMKKIYCLTSTFENEIELTLHEVSNRYSCFLWTFIFENWSILCWWGLGEKR